MYQSSVSQIFIVAFSIFILIFAIKSFEKALLFIVFTLPIIPDFFGFIISDSLTIVNVQKCSLTIIGLVWIVNKLTRKEYIFQRDFTSIAIIILVFAQSLSLISSTDIRNSLGFYARILIEWYLIFFIVSDTVKTIPQIKRACTIIVASGVIIAVVAILRHISDIYVFNFLPVVSAEALGYSGMKLRSGLSREFGVFEHAILFGMYLNLILPISFYIFIEKKEKMGKILYGCFFVFIIIALFFTISRSAWIGGAVSIIIIFMFLKLKEKLKISLIFILAILILNLLANNRVYDISLMQLSSFLNIKYTPFNSAVEYDLDMVQSLGGRIAKVEDGWKAVKDNPIFGTGLRNEQKTLGFSIGDNSYFMKIAIESGLLGLASFLIVILSILFKLFFVFLKSSHTENKFLALALLCSIIGYLISIQAATFYNIFYLFWIICALSNNMALLDSERVISG
jgi:O-antigen ligase